MWLLFWEMALSVSYWSPMEKLILHLSPVARRRTLKNNSTNSTSCNNTSSLGRINRHRNRSEPNPNSRAASMKNVSVFTTVITQSDSNSLNCDVKTLRLFYINQVRCFDTTHSSQFEGLCLTKGKRLKICHTFDKRKP